MALGSLLIRQDRSLALALFLHRQTQAAERRERLHRQARSEAQAQAGLELLTRMWPEAR